MQSGVLRRATTSTTLRALALVSGVGGLEASLISDEALEMERTFARQGLELTELLGAIRIGYTALATALLDATVQLAPPPDNSRELRRIAVLLLNLVDEFTGAATTAFLDEQRAQAVNVSAAKFETVKSIVEGQPIDPGRAERLLNYPIGQCHLAIIAWSDGTQTSATRDLRKVVDLLLRHWGPPIATLAVPVGSHSLWAWASVAEPAQLPTSKTSPLPDSQIALGRIESGIDGFRESHLQARAVQQLVRLRADLPPSTTAHEDLELELLLLADLGAARQFVDRHLGPLSMNDPRMSQLRTTLRNYLNMDHSLVRVAATEHISRNTVTYRVQQAFKLCGHPAGGPTNKLRAAITMCDWINGSTPP